MATPLTPYDAAAHDQFCSDLVRDGFEPVAGTERRRWRGPLRDSLRHVTDAATMEVLFYDGWPYKYAHVIVSGLDTDHSGNGIVCLWADDDPAQVRGVALDALWRRLDEWAAAAAGGFGVDDQSLDAYIAFDGTAQRFAELDLPLLLVGASNGHIAPVYASVEQDALMLDLDPADRPLTGVLYYRTGITRPPRTLDQFRAALTRRQLANFDDGLRGRADVGENEPSGAHDHVVLVWPRHSAHDALVLSFSGTGDTLAAHPNAPSPTDQASRLRRAGPDATLLADKRVLLAGVGAIGGFAAPILANSGLGHLTIRDGDVLKTVNLVRHAGTRYDVGWSKFINTAVRIKGTAPWCDVDGATQHLPLDPTLLAPAIDGYDLVVDCTGIAAVTAALAHVCAREHVPLLTVALYHRGSLLRLRRQGPDDTPFLSRPSDSRYHRPPPDPAASDARGFLELGCTALVHNAPPAAALQAAGAAAAAAIDFLTGRRDYPDEVITVLQPLAAPPFDRLGPVPPPAAPAATS